MNSVSQYSFTFLKSTYKFNKKLLTERLLVDNLSQFPSTAPFATPYLGLQKPGKLPLYRDIFFKKWLCYN